ncbi:MAG: ferrous iron transport protein A [Magnetococcales bacterium]|nr:ferrous iron transport protein A [Magnetococcales bacterium]
MKHPLPDQQHLTLADLKAGETGIIRRIEGDDTARKRLMSMGFVSGKTITMETHAPWGGPGIYSILGYRICVPNNQAKNIIITKGHPSPNHPAHSLNTTPLQA